MMMNLTGFFGFASWVGIGLGMISKLRKLGTAVMGGRTSRSGWVSVGGGGCGWVGWWWGD
jgi:hypothetical protein